MYDRVEIEKIQKRKLEILKDIVHFCEEHQLTYWLDSGTLLGAIRHQGFIPWDDDIDIIMLEKDISILRESYRSEDFELVETQAEDLNFYKIISKKEFVQIEDKKMNLDIDIFPVNYYKNCLALRFWNSFFHLRKNRIDHFSFGLFLENLSINVRRKFESTKMFHYKNLEKKLKQFVKTEQKEANLLAYTYNCGFNLTLWKIEEVFPLREVEFEGLLLKVPNNYDAYLKKLYYSYMDLPPEERRVPGHYKGKMVKLISKIEDVEKSETKYIQRIKKYLEDELDIKSEDVYSINCLGGMTNHNFIIEMKKGKYVFRLPGEGCSYFINRENENYNIHAIQNEKIDVEILYFNEVTGVKITKYLEEAETLTPKIAVNYRNEVANTLKQLHTSGILLKNHFDVFAEILHYESGISEKISEKYPEYESCRAEIFHLQEELRKMGQQMVSCHNDTVPENFVFSKGKMYLIDWEYSGMNELEWDLGAFCLESNFSKQETQKFLQIYFLGNIKKDSLKKVRIYQICQDFLWSLWTLLKEEQGEDFGDYGIKRYQRALCLLKELKYEFEE